MRFWTGVVTAILCGWLLAQPYRYYEGSLPVWLALAPVLWSVARAPAAWGAALTAGLFAFVWSFFSFNFLWGLATPGMFALCVYTALCYTGALLAARWLARRGVVNAVFGTAAVWVLVELFRSCVPVFAFPWLLLGHPLLGHENLRQAADLGGVSGLSFGVAAVNALLAFTLPAWLPQKWQAVPGGNPRSAWKALSFVAALWRGLAAYGRARIDELTPRLQAGAPIAVIQGNVAQKLGLTYEEVDGYFKRHLAMHRELIETARRSGPLPVLICWAETMVPGTLNTDEWGTRFIEQVRQSGVAALTGSNYTPPEDAAKPAEEQRTYNSAYLLDAQGAVLLRYAKRRLVPFGEYIPFTRPLPFLKILRSITRDQYTPGTEPSPVHQIGGYAIALNICVEDIHPDLAREAACNGADTLINLTNDGWFYGNYGPRAHLLAAAWRAIEVRRPMLRITNTGRTVAIDPLGNAEELVPPEKEGVCVTHLLRISPRSGQSAAPKNLVTPLMALGEGGLALGMGLILALCTWAACKHNP